MTSDVIRWQDIQAFADALDANSVPLPLHTYTEASRLALEYFWQVQAKPVTLLDLFPTLKVKPT